MIISVLRVPAKSLWGNESQTAYVLILRKSYVCQTSHVLPENSPGRMCIIDVKFWLRLHEKTIKYL